MTTLDLIILAVAGLSIVLALWRGLVRTLFGLAAWASALIVSPFLAQWLSGRFELGWGLSLGASFLLVFLAVRFVGALVARGMAKVGLSSVDRLLGAVFGAARALLLIGVFAMLGHAFGMDRTLTWKEATLAPFLDAIVQWVEPMLPEKLGGPVKT